MIDFAADLGAIMEDGLAVDAVFIPAVGDSASVRVIRLAPDDEVRFGGSRLRTATTILTVAIAAVPVVAKADRFEIGGASYVVQGAPSRDTRGLRWRIEAVPE